MATYWSERMPHKYSSEQNINTKQNELDGNISHSGVPGGGVQNSPPPEIPKALQNRAKLKPDCENC